VLELNDQVINLISGVVGAVIGAIATWWAADRQLRSTQVRAEVVETEKIFVDKPTLYPVFFEGQMPQGDQQRYEALAVCRLLANAYSYRLEFLNTRFGGLRSWIEGDIETRGAMSPFWVQFLEANKKEYRQTAALQLKLAQQGAESDLGKEIRAAASKVRPLLPGQSPASVAAELPGGPPNTPHTSDTSERPGVAGGHEAAGDTHIVEGRGAAAAEAPNAPEGRPVVDR
jgi:hypothetical protein